MDEDEKIKDLIGKPYWENRHLLRYGGTVDSKGIIREAHTKDEIKPCPIFAKNKLKDVMQ